jgi:hypothetical protein
MVTIQGVFDRRPPQNTQGIKVNAYYVIMNRTEEDVSRTPMLGTEKFDPI